jgi:TolA-binding protein
MFDLATFPPALRESIRGETMIKSAENGTYNVLFGKNTRTQFVRLLLTEYDGPAPSIKRIALVTTEGEKILPVAGDFQALRKNTQLEVSPGDSVFVKYEDDNPYTESRTQQQRSLHVAYNNGSISASFIYTKKADDGSRELDLQAVRRFRMDDNLAFVIRDVDMDVSAERDIVPFIVKTSDGVERTYKAYETKPHSGVFLGKVFPITGTPQRESEIKVSEGGTLTGIYTDTENTNPGVETDRSVMVEHALYRTPRFGVYSMKAEPLPFRPVEQKQTESGGDIAAGESIVPRMQVESVLLDEEDLKTVTPQALYDSSITFKVVAPHLALSAFSHIKAYVQTEYGRQAYLEQRKKAEAEGKKLSPSATPFDVNVPGTLVVGGKLNHAGNHSLPRGYKSGGITEKNMGERGMTGSALYRGDFEFDIRLKMEDVPERSFANQAAEGIEAPNTLAVRPGDKVHIGYAFMDKAENVQWRTATVELSGNTFMDVLDESYHSHLKTRFVGDRAYVRVVAPALNTSDERQQVTVQVSAASGVNAPFSMWETSENSGVFKGNFKLGILEDSASQDFVTSKDMVSRGLPVVYSDTVTVTRAEALPASFSFTINNGADGLVEAFSKQYSDGRMAIEANFALAECYFEQAKVHRMMGKQEDDEELKSIARREMEHAKKLLEEALSTYREEELQAHAQYLLANLSQEYADTAENEESKKENYKDALTRFSMIPIDYPESPFASQAQFKKALVYEKMEQYDHAVEEYVKLAYKYPDNELIPEAMSRIGAFFEKRGIDYKKKADVYFEKGDDTSVNMAQDLMNRANQDFQWSASVFLHFAERYPEHQLAGRSELRAGQNRMRYGDFSGAIEILERVAENFNYDGPDVRAQALFWAGMSHEKLMRPNLKRVDVHKEMAKDLYKQIIDEYSASHWAGVARGRMASGEL